MVYQSANQLFSNTTSMRQAEKSAQLEDPNRLSEHNTSITYRFGSTRRHWRLWARLADGGWRRAPSDGRLHFVRANVWRVRRRLLPGRCTSVVKAMSSRERE